MNANSSSTVFCAAADQLAALRMIVEHLAPDLQRRPPAGGSIRPRSPRNRPALSAARARQSRSSSPRDVDQLLGAISRLDVGRSDCLFIGGVREHLRLELGGVFVDGAARRVGGGLQSRPSPPSRRHRRTPAADRARADRDAPRNITIAALDEHARRVLQVLARRREQLRHAASFVVDLRAPATRPATTPSSSGCGRHRRSPTRRSSGCVVQVRTVSRSSTQPSMTPCRMRRSTRSSASAARDRSRRAGAETHAASRSRRRLPPREKSSSVPVVRVNAVAGGDRRMPSGELIEVFVDDRGECPGGLCR